MATYRSGPDGGGGFRPRWNADVSDMFGNGPGEGIQSGGHGGDIPDRRDGDRNMPGLGREHVRPEGGNGTEANHDAQADPHKSDEDGADPVS